MRIVLMDPVALIFALYNGEKLLLTHANPKHLARKAWAFGAETIRHDYDLALGEAFV